MLSTNQQGQPGKYQTIKGWACHGKGEPLVRYEYTSAELLDTDVEIQISHCGICGSDIHTMDSGWGPTEYPVIVGHEIVGTVTAKGSKVTELEVGDRVGVGAQCGACLSADCFACSRNKDAHCPQSVFTYNARRPFDNSKAYGGYAEAVRVQKDYAFKIPEQIPSEYAAPLLCAGATVFTPMLRHKFKEGDRVGVIGIGGLGHLAIKFARALGCHVTALSHSPSKKDETIKMGADSFVNLSIASEVETIKNSLNFLIVTSNAEDLDFSKLNTWMDIEGNIILLAIAEKNLSVAPFSIITKDVSISGSLIGSINEIKQMLAFAAKHNVRPIIERFSMDRVNEGVQHVRDGKVRYRVVLEN